MKMRVKGFEHYELDSEAGTLFNHRTGRYVGSVKNSNGYVYVQLSNGEHKRTVRLHILMAEHFIPNPENKPTVNHINHIRDDNRVDNLEWATHAEQCDEEWVSKQRVSQLNGKRSKPVRVSNDRFVQDYPSLREACRQLGLNIGNVTSVLKGRYKTTGGYKIEYI